MFANKYFRNTIHWSLTFVAAVFMITGFGITEFRTVERITFGILSKNIAFRIHTFLWIPFLVLLALHIFISLYGRWKRK
ncbi:hypothetical protein ACFLXP_06085 [Chloroflexota bacterium]